MPKKLTHIKPRLFKNIGATPKQIRLQTDGAWSEQTSYDAEERIIRNVSVISYGKARTKNKWVDREMVMSVVRFGQSFGEKGVKTRVSHPGLSSDGIADTVGYVNNFSLSADGTKAIADLHFNKASRLRPGGDFAPFIEAMSEERPQDFGLSIVGDPDERGELSFVEANRTNGNYKSPDPMNVDNYPHARVLNLRAVDLVGDPAANENGLFSSNGNAIPFVADKILDYVFGMDDAIDINALPLDFAESVHPDRVKTYVENYLRRKGIALSVDGGNAPDNDLGQNYQTNRDAIQDSITELSESIRIQDEMLSTLSRRIVELEEATNKRIANIFKCLK